MVFIKDNKKLGNILVDVLNIKTMGKKNLKTNNGFELNH